MDPAKTSGLNNSNLRVKHSPIGNVLSPKSTRPIKPNSRDDLTTMIATIPLVSEIYLVPDGTGATPERYPCFF